MNAPAEHLPREAMDPNDHLLKGFRVELLGKKGADLDTTDLEPIPQLLAGTGSEALDGEVFDFVDGPNYRVRWGGRIVVSNALTSEAKIRLNDAYFTNLDGLPI